MKTKAKYKLSTEQREWLVTIPRLYIPTNQRSTIISILERGRYTKKQREVLNDIRLRYIIRETNLKKALNPKSNQQRNILEAMITQLENERKQHIQ